MKMLVRVKVPHISPKIILIILAPFLGPDPHDRDHSEPSPPPVSFGPPRSRWVSRSYPTTRALCYRPASGLRPPKLMPRPSRMRPPLLSHQRSVTANRCRRVRTVPAERRSNPQNSRAYESRPNLT